MEDDPERNECFLWLNEYMNVFGCSYFCRTNIQIYSLNLYSVNEYQNIFVRYKDTRMNARIYSTLVNLANENQNAMIS